MRECFGWERIICWSQCNSDTGKKIGCQCIIGAGTVVRKNMEDFSMMYGKSVKKRRGRAN